MSLTASDSGSNYTPPPAGTYRAVCTGVVDMGTQTHAQYGSRVQVLLTWEIDELTDEGTPYRVHRRFTRSLHEKSTLRAVLQSWRGRAFSDEELKGFDLRNILGKPCMLSVVHTVNDGRTYANIASVSSLLKGSEPLQPTIELTSFDLDEPDEAVLDKFSDRLQEQIKATPEWKTYKQRNGSQEPHSADLPDEIAGQFDDLPF